jgi:hypothetical protein
MSRDQSIGPDPQWHLPPTLLAAYANGQAGPTDAWSAEAHLVACSLCRAELALVTAPPHRAAISDVRSALLAALPAQAPARATRWVTLPSSARLALRPSSVVAVVLTLAVALLLNAAWLSGADLDVTGSGLLWLVAPVLPLGGVALCSVGEHDPWREAVLATPSAGLRLILWRTAVVLAVAVPSAALAGLLLGAVGPALWLLPCLALTTVTLALGTLVGLGRAAAAVATLWCTGALTPALISSGGQVSRALQEHIQTNSYATTTVFSTPAQGMWAVVALTAIAVLVLRRHSYEQLPRAAGARAV